MAGMQGRIEDALTQTFTPAELVVADVSEGHRGHAGFQEGGESHWEVRIRSTAFAGQSRIARHRAVHKALGAEIMGAIHALALDIDIP